MAASNLYFPKVFVFNPSTELVTTDTVRPYQLTLNQVGFFAASTGKGVGASPDAQSIKAFSIHQNLGRSAGTVRTEGFIDIDKILDFRKVEPKAATAMIKYIGYNTSSGALVVPKDTDINVNFVLYSKNITLFAGPGGQLDSVTIRTLNSDTPATVASDFCDKLVAYVNSVAPVPTAFDTGREISEHIVATKVSSGSNYGVKLEAKILPEVILDPSKPEQVYEPDFIHFDVSVEQLSGVTAVVTHAQQGNPVQGSAIQVASFEKESQGYDFVRNQYSESRYYTGDNKYIIRAVNGTTYDMFTLEYTRVHHKPGVINGGTIPEKFAVIFFCPTGTGANLESLIAALRSQPYAAADHTHA